MRSVAFGIALLVVSLATSLAQQPDSQKNKADKAKSEQTAAKPEPKSQEIPTEDKAAETAKGPGDQDKEEHFDVNEVPPIVTHHQTSSEGKLLKYTATTGRLPIKRGDGKIEAEMFFVAYTLDGQEASRRPLTFAFNGGPGSATVWLHMGALGPKHVVLTPDGFLPPAPYRLEDNPYTLLDKSDLVFVTAIGTGFSRAETTETAKKFWGVKGDIDAFSEFIRLYITRYERWPSPLFLLGESYGTTRSAGRSEERRVGKERRSE